MKMVRADKATCTGCEACVTVCPVDCITMTPDEEGFAYPVIDEARCIHCGRCTRVCPVDRARERPWQMAYAAFSTESGLRESSSSGGVFSLLAQRVLARGGAVYGAALEQEHRVQHIRAGDAEGLLALRGSKYVQSGRLAPCYQEIKKDLAGEGRALFSGTPCQVAGLYAALGERHPEKLQTVDLVCHGVPSPMVYAAYVREMERRQGSSIADLSFRDKTRGWKDFGMRLSFVQGPDYLADQRTDPFLVAFLQNACLRPSCHQCPFAGVKRQADLTLADCWGAAKVAPELDDDRGLSLALVQAGQGEAMWRAIAPQLTAKKVEAGETSRDNPSILRSARPHEKRAAFLRHVNKHGMRGTEKFFRPPGLAARIWRKGLRILSGLNPSGEKRV